MFLLRKQSRILRSERMVWNTTLSFSTSFVPFAFGWHAALISLRCHFFWYCCLLEMEEPGWQQSNPWCAEKHITVAAHLSHDFIHSTGTDGTLLYTSSLPPLLVLIAGLFPCYSKLTTSGHCATHGLAVSCTLLSWHTSPRRSCARLVCCLPARLAATQSLVLT